MDLAIFCMVFPGVSKTIFILVGLFYGYGALVHVMNMLSMTGFNWMSSPMKWQVLDVVYLVIDVVVCVGFLRGWSVATWCFYVAAVSQIMLYTVFRDWILDVPVEFAVSSEQAGYLNGLVAFHSVTLALVSFALWWQWR